MNIHFSGGAAGAETAKNTEKQGGRCQICEETANIYALLREKALTSGGKSGKVSTVGKGRKFFLP
jgi:hypothetical protein